MNFNLRKRLQENRDSDSTLGTPFTQEQEERLQELIRTEVLRVLGAGPSTPRARIGLDGEKDQLEEALRRAAERASTRRASDMQRLMQETSASKDQAESNDKAPIGEDVIDEREWDITVGRCDQEKLPLERKLVYWVKAEIQRKDQKVFENVIGRQIALFNHLATITESRIKHFLASSGQVSASALIMCKLEVDDF